MPRTHAHRRLLPTVLCLFLAAGVPSCDAADDSGDSGDGIRDGSPGAGTGPGARLSVSVAPRRVPPGGSLEIRFEGAPPASTVQLGFGPVRSEYEILDSLTVGSGGNGVMSLTVPPFALPGRPYVVVAREGAAGQEVVSQPVLVLGATDTLTVRGSLTGEGVECPTLRTPLGVVYALTGLEARDLEEGEELVIRATVPDISICMQGIPLSVVEVTRP